MMAKIPTLLEEINDELERTKARLQEATELLAIERSWAGCFCFLNGTGEHEVDCTWPEFLARYEEFKKGAEA